MTASTKNDDPAGGAADLWVGLLAAPVAWAAQMQLNYMLVPWACASGHHFVLALVSVAALLTASAGALVAFRAWRRAGRGTQGEAGGPAARSRFMAALGLLVSAMFFVVVLAQAIPILILNPCQQ